MKHLILLTSILTTGLSAGLFYAWAVSVIPGTKLITDKSYLETMQSINRAIINPGFLVIFLGTVLLMVATVYFNSRDSYDLRFWLSTSALLVYLVGTVGVTSFGNVPLNNGLDGISIESLTAVDLKATRLSYENAWNKLHNIRTIFAVISFLLLILCTNLIEILSSIFK